jgi:pentatricopeptide repeat protein
MVKEGAQEPKLLLQAGNSNTEQPMQQLMSFSLQKVLTTTFAPPPSLSATPHSMICPSCRRILLRRRALRLGSTQWRPNASFHSLVDLVPPPLDEKHQPKTQQARIAYPNSSPAHIKFDELFLNKEALKTKRASRYARVRPRDASEEELASQFSPKDDSDDAVSRHSGIFPLTETTDKPDQKISTALSGENARHVYAPSDMDMDIQHSSLIQTSDRTGPATRLHKLLTDRYASGLAIWTLFEKYYPNPNCTALLRPHLQDLPLLADGQLFSILLVRMTKIWLSKNESSLPTPAQVVERLRHLQLMRAELYPRLIWRLAFAALYRAYHNNGNVKLSVPLLLDQILLLWSQLFQDSTKESARAPFTTQEGPIDWSGLPQPQELDVYNVAKLKGILLSEAEATMAEKKVAARLTERRSIGVRLTHDLQDFPGNVRNVLAASAVATFTLMTQLSKSDVDASRPFLRYLTQLLYRCDLTQTAYNMWGYLEGRGKYAFSPASLAAIKALVYDIPSQVALILGTGSTDAISPQSNAAVTSEVGEHLEESFREKIFQRVKRNNTHQLIRIWFNAKEVYTKLNLNEYGRGQIPPKLYANFIYAFGRLNRSDMADEVWNHMVANKIPPSVEHWSALMNGRGRRYQAVEEIWAKMINSGVEPDARIWTTRIHVLLTAAPTPHKGLFALENMGNAWLREVKNRYGKTNGLDLSTIGDLPGAPKPNVVTLNAAVSALANRRKEDRNFFPRVFAWATQFRIKPDVRTYNALVQECLAESNMQEARKILARMEQQKVQPDGATFGMFINYIFRQQQKVGDQMNTEQQEEMLASILVALEERGMESDEYTMGLLFDILVKQYNNLSAAQKVLEYMAEKGMKPSPHIYTILITHHFQQADNPDGTGVPDFSAIEALWSHIQISGGVVDNIFYDRMIEGYARAGEPVEAMSFLSRMGREAKRPGWQALYMIVRSLAENGMMDRVREIVDDVENFEGNVREGVRGYNKWGVKFWDFVVECGIRTRPEGRIEARDDDADWLDDFKEREVVNKELDGSHAW